VEVKKTTPVTYQPRPEPTPYKAEPSKKRQETFATPSIDNRIKEETEKAKKLGLEIAPPTNTIATNSNTNTSPKKNSKIAPNTPVQEKIETTPVVEPPKKIEPAVATTNKTVSQNIATSNAAQSNVQYCVQLAASPTMLNASVGKWTRITETVEVIQEANLYKYQVRNFATHQEAARAMSGLRAKGFSDAFVVAYKDGQRVDPKTLK
jgi:N-acetylmuramoyl-L-alanine amidase